MKSQIRKPILISAIILLAVASIISGLIFLLHNNNLPQDNTPVNSTPINSEPPYNFDYSWANANHYIARAFGGILGDSYTNSYEAFLLNYQLGHRVFEVDFSITDDGYTVAAHDTDTWSSSTTIPPDAEIKTYPIEDKQFTYDNFMSSLSHGKYHTVDLDILFSLLQKYPDIYIVTDTKYADETNVRKQFSAFVATANTINPELLDRFIVQIYQPEMLDWVMDIYPWKSVIYTLYQNTDWTPENILAFSKASGVKFITMWDTWLTAEISNLWKPTGIKIATHTLNSLARAQDSQSRGADVIYTDFLLP